MYNKCVLRSRNQGPFLKKWKMAYFGQILVQIAHISQPCTPLCCKIVFLGQESVTILTIMNNNVDIFIVFLVYGHKHQLFNVQFPIFWHCSQNGHFLRCAYYIACPISTTNSCKKYWFLFFTYVIDHHLPKNTLFCRITSQLSFLYQYLSLGSKWTPGGPQRNLFAGVLLRVNRNRN